MKLATWNVNSLKVRLPQVLDWLAANPVDALWQSQVVLSQSGNLRSMKRDDNDGRLYAMELMGWDLSGLDLLVLSACETARGAETFVGGLRGLPTAMVAATRAPYST